MHRGVTRVPTGKAHTGPLVLGPQVGPKLIRICPEAVGSPYLGIVSNLFGLLQKQSLASHVCPATQPAYNFAHSNVFMNIPHPPGLATLTCLAPCSHSATSPNHCLGNLLHSLVG